MRRCRTDGAADAAVGLSGLAAATVTQVTHGHLQLVFEAHGFDGEALVSTTGRAAPRLHAHVERHLPGRGKTVTYCLSET